MPLADRTKWDARYRERADPPRDPHPSLLDLAGILPATGRALDLAGGSGQDARWLARRGLDVTLADISTVALERATRLATDGGGSIRPLAIDLEEAPFPTGPWDLILCVRFLHRPTYRAIVEHLRPGGLAVVVHPTRTNRERHDRPGPAHLLGPGELPDLLPGLELIRSWEGWSDEGRHEAGLVGRRAQGGPR